MNLFQTFANILTSIGVILAIIVFFMEVKRNRKERSLSIFLKLLDIFKEILTEKSQIWDKIKSSSTMGVINDKTIPLDYILTRIKQPQPLQANELGWIELEIRSLNLMNVLCKYAIEDEQITEILKNYHSYTISYYQHKLCIILEIRESQKHLLLFSIPRYEYLKKIKVSEYVQNN